VTFLGVASFANGVATPSAALPVSALNRFGRKSFDDLIHLELEATAESLRRLGRPNGTIAIPQLDEASMGALFMFFELAVASMGELMNINAYDQPGVESSKTIMHSGLAKL
jgi:glucose-6-phosphate isomerase